MIHALLAVAVMQAAAPPPRMIEAKSPADIAAVSLINDSMAALGRKVAACVAGGQPVGKCQCNSPAELGRLRLAYENLVRQRPEWKDQVLGYQYHDKTGKNISGAVVMQNMRRQLEALKCQ